MLFAVLLPVLIGLFPLAVGRFGTRVCEPRDQDAGAPGPRSIPNDDRTGRHAAAPDPAAGDGHNDNEADVDREGPGRPNGGVGPWTHR